MELLRLLCPVPQDPQCTGPIHCPPKGMALSTGIVDHGNGGVGKSWKRPTGFWVLFFSVLVHTAQEQTLNNISRFILGYQNCEETNGCVLELPSWPAGGMSYQSFSILGRTSPSGISG